MSDKIYTLNDGFSVTRRATPEFIDPVTNVLQQEFGANSHIELRSSRDEANSRKPSIVYFGRSRVGGMGWPTDTPLRPVIRNIVESVPMLDDPLDIVFNDVTTKTHEGGRFLSLYPSDEGRKTLIRERQKIFDATNEVTRARRLWPMPDLVMTLAYGQPEISEAAWDGLAQRVGSLLPLEVELQPGIIRPEIEF
jgi:hypothetical protein